MKAYQAYSVEVLISETGVCSGCYSFIKTNNTRTGGDHMDYPADVSGVRQDTLGIQVAYCYVL